MEETPVPLPPEPELTGVQLDQRNASEEESRVLVPIVEGGAPSGLSKSLGAIGESGIRGHAGTILLQAGVAHLEGEISQLRVERDAAEQKAERYKDQYHTEKERASVLETERDAAKTVNRFRQILITLGAGIGGLGLRGLAESMPQVWSWPATIIGAVLLLLGLFLPDRRIKR